MKKCCRILLSVVLALLFAAGLGLTIRQGLQYAAAARDRQQTDQILSQAMEAATEATSEPPTQVPTELPTEATTDSTEATEATEETEATEPTQPTLSVQDQAPLNEKHAFLLNLDLSELQAVNEDVFGWIHIPGTNISYPLLRSRDNADYLTHAWDGTPSGSGSIFLECRNNSDFRDFNTILYGHHMRDGSFFADLVYYKFPGHRDAHATVYVVTEEQLLRYEIFAAYEAAITGDTYRLEFPGDGEKQAALDAYLENALTDTLNPTGADHILTLSTCTGGADYNYRWVVQAVLTGTWER